MLYIQDCYKTTQAYAQQHPTNPPNNEVRVTCSRSNQHHPQLNPEDMAHGLKALALATTVGVIYVQ